jgi:hypothetical protein
MTPAHNSANDSTRRKFELGIRFIGFAPFRFCVRRAYPFIESGSAGFTSIINTGRRPGVARMGDSVTALKSLGFYTARVALLFRFCRPLREDLTAHFAAMRFLGVARTYRRELFCDGMREKRALPVFRAVQVVKRYASAAPRLDVGPV